MNLNNHIEKIKDAFLKAKNETFKKAVKGTKHEVYLSKNFAIRFKKNKQNILKRETNLLNKLNHPLIPKIVNSGMVDSIFYSIENRLPGETIDIVWKNLSRNNKEKIASQFIDFLKFIKSKKSQKINSVKTGKNYTNFYKYLIDDFDNKVKTIAKLKSAKKILANLVSIIKTPAAQKLFNNVRPALVHGDLIFHNLLTDGKNLTGVLDWELSFYGDPDYDIFRLMNFKRSAKIYLDQGIDTDFEHDYLNEILNSIQKSGITVYDKKFFKKYEICRAIYYLDALFWAVNSQKPEENIKEVILASKSKNT